MWQGSISSTYVQRTSVSRVGGLTSIPEDTKCIIASSKRHKKLQRIVQKWNRTSVARYFPRIRTGDYNYATFTYSPELMNELRNNGIKFLTTHSFNEKKTKMWDFEKFPTCQWLREGVVVKYRTPQRIDLLRTHRTPNDKECGIIYQPVEGGSTNVATRLEHEQERVSVLIAGNSGRPGGMIGHIENGRGVVRDLGNSHSTQEEDVVSNWLLTYENITGYSPSHVYDSTIGGRRRWGMVNPGSERSAKTLQGVNYKSARPGDYYDAWIVNDCFVSEKKKDVAYGDGDAYNTSCSLVFVAGPCCLSRSLSMGGNATKDYTRTIDRTYNDAMNNDYDLFIRGVAETFRAALDAMILNDVTVAILCHVSGGVYAGNHAIRYGDRNKDDCSELQEVVKKVLGEKPGLRDDKTQTQILLNDEADQKERRYYFKEVVIVKYLPLTA